jgi:hypothetical protein
MENYYVDTNNKCVACAANKLNPAGDDARGAATTCDGFRRCGVNQRVTAGAPFTCASCPPGSTQALDTDGNGLLRDQARSCTATTCDENHHVASNVCEPCAKGTTRTAGDVASGPDTTCSHGTGGQHQWEGMSTDHTATTTMCTVNQRVVNHACVACVAVGGVATYSPAGADPNGQDTYCSATTPAAISHAASLCSTGEHVVDHVCVTCATTHGNAFYENAAGDDRNHQNTYCTKKLCAVDQKVVSNVCTNCGALLKAPAAWIGGADTACH